jgi:hypothetical protein
MRVGMGLGAARHYLREEPPLALQERGGGLKQGKCERFERPQKKNVEWIHARAFAGQLERWQTGERRQDCSRKARRYQDQGEETDTRIERATSANWGRSRGYVHRKGTNSRRARSVA